MVASAPTSLAPDHRFANGSTVAAVVSFVLDYEGQAPIAAVASYFGLTVAEVDAVLDCHARHHGAVTELIGACNR